MTALENLRATLRSILPEHVDLPADDEGLTRLAASGDLDLEEFYLELGESVEDLPGKFPDEEPFFLSTEPHLSDAQVGALAWLAPLSSRAEHLRASSAWSCDDPTLQSLAASFEEGRSIKSGLVWRQEPPPARTFGDAVHAGRNMVLGSFIAAGGFPMLEFLTCRPVCRACAASPLDTLPDLWPVTFAFAAALPMLSLLPGIVVLVRSGMGHAVPVR